jgi:ribonuclease J
MLVSINDAKLLPDNEIVFLVTGSQAEPRAALYQLATQIYKGLTIEEGDTVVLSARIIPGNERAISKLSATSTTRARTSSKRSGA